MRNIANSNSEKQLSISFAVDLLERSGLSALGFYCTCAPFDSIFIKKLGAHIDDHFWCCAARGVMASPADRAAHIFLCVLLLASFHHVNAQEEAVCKFNIIF